MTADIDIPEFKFQLFILFPYLLLEMMQHYEWTDRAREEFMASYKSWARIIYVQWLKDTAGLTP